MQPDHTPADPLDEAIEAAWDAFKAATRTLETTGEPPAQYFRPASLRESVEDAVRAAAPIIGRTLVDAGISALRYTLDKAKAENADLRARLATAERDAWTQAADALRDRDQLRAWLPFQLERLGFPDKDDYPFHMALADYLDDHAPKEAE